MWVWKVFIQPRNVVSAYDVVLGVESSAQMDRLESAWQGPHVYFIWQRRYSDEVAFGPSQRWRVYEFRTGADDCFVVHYSLVVVEVDGFDGVVGEEAVYFRLVN